MIARQIDLHAESLTGLFGLRLGEWFVVGRMNGYIIDIRRQVTVVSNQQRMMWMTHAIKSKVPAKCARGWTMSWAELEVTQPKRLEKEINDRERAGLYICDKELWRDVSDPVWLVLFSNAVASEMTAITVTENTSFSYRRECGQRIIK